MNLRTKQSSELGVPVLLFVLALALYLPGINWGQPAGDGPGKTVPWGPDEIAPMGPILQSHSFLTKGQIGSLKYPIFHYLTLAGAYAPYLGYLLLTGKLVNPGAGYPFGFTDPVTAIQSLTLIARLVSMLMAAGIVVVAYFTAKMLWDRISGVLAGVCVLLMYSLFYYGRVSNVDVPAMFWCGLVLLLAARVQREGWTLRLAIGMGIFAALAIATKDQNYAVLLLLPLGLIPAHFRVMREKGLTDFWSCWKAPIIGLLASVAAYAVASGLALHPPGYFRHLAFIRSGWVGNYPSLWYFRYSATLEGYLGLSGESFSQIVDSLGWPFFLAACAGIVLCVVQERSKLIFLLTIPILFVGVILPVRHTALRFMLPAGFVLALYAGRALAAALESSRRALRATAWLVLLAGAGLQLARAADLTYLLLNDPRYAATAWLERYARPGDRLEYFESVTGEYRVRIHKFPRIPKGVEVLDAATTLQPGSRPINGDFVLTLGPEDQQLHWFCPAATHAALKNGSLGYDLVAVIKKPALFSHPHLNHINMPIEIFVRRDRVAQLGLRPAEVPRQ